jgi:hypothetical protein
VGAVAFLVGVCSETEAVVRFSEDVTIFRDTEVVKLATVVVAGNETPEADG